MGDVRKGQVVERESSGMSDKSKCEHGYTEPDSYCPECPNPKAQSELSATAGSPTSKWETVSKAQAVLLMEQSRLITELTVERDEARNNLRTASAQWAQWRKQAMQENDKIQP